MALVHTNNIELTFASYQDRQWHHISEKGLEEDLAKAKISNKFLCQNNRWEKISYPGFAVVSKLKNNPGNDKLIHQLSLIQHRLVDEAGLEHLIFKLPKESFHQTVANTLSDERFMENIRLAGIEKDYPFMVKSAFEEIKQPDMILPIEMQLIGLSIFGSSIGVLGVFENPNDYERILIFREDFYANKALSNLNVKCTRPFIGHITLGYFGKSPNEKELMQLKQSLYILNQEFIKTKMTFKISNTQLAYYDELSVFNVFPHFPVFDFI